MEKAQLLGGETNSYLLGGWIGLGEEAHLQGGWIGLGEELVLWSGCRLLFGS
jgi:hypothetical protein